MSNPIFDESIFSVTAIPYISLWELSLDIVIEIVNGVNGVFLSLRRIQIACPCTKEKINAGTGCEGQKDNATYSEEGL